MQTVVCVRGTPVYVFVGNWKYVTEALADWKSALAKWMVNDNPTDNPTGRPFWCCPEVKAGTTEADVTYLENVDGEQMNCNHCQ